jgi:hypothetical protein
MLRHGRLTNLDRRDDLAHRQRAPLASKQVQDLDPRRIGQTAKPARIQLRLIPLQHHRSSTIDDNHPPRKRFEHERCAQRVNSASVEDHRACTTQRRHTANRTCSSSARARPGSRSRLSCTPSAPTSGSSTASSSALSGRLRRRPQQRPPRRRNTDVLVGVIREQCSVHVRDLSVEGALLRAVGQRETDQLGAGKRSRARDPGTRWKRSRPSPTMNDSGPLRPELLIVRVRVGDEARGAAVAKAARNNGRGVDLARSGADPAELEPGNTHDQITPR